MTNDPREHAVAGRTLLLGQRLRQLRVHARLTQAELARTLALSTSSITNYEKGTHLPSLDVLWRMADALRQPARALLEGVDLGRSVRHSQQLQAQYRGNREDGDRDESGEEEGR